MLRTQRAHWLARDIIAWPIADPATLKLTLHASKHAALRVGKHGVKGGHTFQLTHEPMGLSDALREAFPHLCDCAVFKLSDADAARAAELLRRQLAISAHDANGNFVGATGLQIGGALDDLYADVAAQSQLGVTWKKGRPTVSVWAPTARAVRLVLFDRARSRKSAKFALRLDETSGVWSARGKPSWKGKYHLFEVEVFVPREGAFATNLSTDPYSLGLGANGERSLFIDLDDAKHKPAKWDALAKPTLARIEDSVIYELHVRDFSIGDKRVPRTLRGKFAAFGVTKSHGMRHLKSLAKAGLTHVHLLPSFDFSSVEEIARKRDEPDAAKLRRWPPNSEKQAATVEKFGARDGFNWGYDPHHFSAPEGSYATNADGPARTREFRGMVQALNAIGLRVVMDVVYNHTTDSGQSPRSTFDKIVPGYYYRLNADGFVENSTCCQNTASERAMFQKFILDSVLTWAREYKVDGFRFDLMGHHMKRTMTALRGALDGLTLERDGVDGAKILLYGEGWDFGEVAHNARGVNASQLNLSGTGIGTFNDRLRDGARGKGFDGPLRQGFVTGLLLAPNAREGRTLHEQLDELLEMKDWIRLGLAGNLKSFEFVDRFGERVAGEGVAYGGQRAGYADAPRETVNYVGAHDNETLFDKLQLALPRDTPMSQRVRANNLAISLVMLGQGIPFFHAGDDILRSKSLDRDSYNSGDWFNSLDFSLKDNGWGRGLPPTAKDRWDDARALLGDPTFAASPRHIRAAAKHFREMLRLRRSSPVFRLASADEVRQRVTFVNTGPRQAPGLIVMKLDAAGLDGAADDAVVVLFNASPAPQTFRAVEFERAQLQLHPTLAKSADPIVRKASFDMEHGSFQLPARTAAVFVGRWAGA